MEIDSLYDELNKLDEWENTAHTLNEFNFEIIAEKLLGANWDNHRAVTGMFSASLFMKSHEKITFIKHPRFICMSDHKHNFLELTYAYKGDFVQVINGERIHMQEGDITILDTNITHRIEPVSKDSLVINILMKEDYFNEQLLVRLSENNLISEFIISAVYKTSLKGRYLYFSPGDNRRIKDYIQSIIWEIKHQQLGSQESINCHTILLFTELMRSMENETSLNIERKRHSGKTSISVFALIQFINEHYMELSLEQTANHFHIHPKYLTRLLKKYTSKGYMEIIQELRMEKAVFLLQNTQLNINEIAENCGFSNINNFYKHFKNTYNKTPKEYRKV
jgi:AraC family transcriptional regulator, melibiose operon regulatory protein